MKYGRWHLEISQDDVQAPIRVVVEDRQSATILDSADAVHMPDFREMLPAVVAEEDVVLAPTQTAITDIQQ